MTRSLKIDCKRNEESDGEGMIKRFGRCQNEEPGTKARKQWSKFKQKLKREEKQIAEKIYRSLIKNIRVDEESHAGQGQAQEGQQACDTQEEDLVNSQLPQLSIRFKHK